MAHPKVGEVVAARLPENLRTEVARLAAADGIPQAEIIRRAVALYVTGEELAKEAAK